MARAPQASSNPDKVIISNKSGKVGEGPKSDRNAVTLQGDDGTTYVLRKQGGLSFGDQSLDSLVGSALTVNGLAVGDTLIMKSWRTKEQH
jgi:hypothetical protein